MGEQRVVSIKLPKLALEQGASAQHGDAIHELICERIYLIYTN